MKIGVFGASGRMGAQVCSAVAECSDLDLIAGVDLGDSLDSMKDVDVAVDFTRPDSVMDNIAWCLAHGKHIVVGTTGFTPGRVQEVQKMVGDNSTLGVVIAPNFSIGAVLMMYFAQKAAPYFEFVEVIEAHHPLKADAPSGTASTMAHMIADARAEAGCPPMSDATIHEEPGARGADIDGVRVHSLRMAGLIAQHEVRMSSSGETLAILNDARDRSSYMPGVLAAVRWVPTHPGLTYGLEKVLDIV